jgi:hypothetical protein
MMTVREGAREGAESDGESDGFLTATDGVFAERPEFRLGRPRLGTSDAPPARLVATCAWAMGWRTRIMANDTLIVFI